MKPNSSFKLSKQTKRISTNFTSSNERNRYIKLMIQAQLLEEEANRKPLKIKDKE